MRTEKLQADLCVVGGGMAGICAAVAGARAGLSVVLVHDRPVLGGNASSEVRVWIQGATASGNNTFAREGGILDEIFLEHLYRNPECNPHLFDAVLLDLVRREKNIRLLLDTAACECTMHADAGDDPARQRKIASVAAFCSLNQTRYEIGADYFLDSSGDGVVGFLAGAEFRFGRESRGEYGEEWAPDQADGLTLGDSMYFYSKRLDAPVRFVAPSFAIDITRAGIPEVRISRIARTAEPYGCELWWWEYGGTLNAIYQADEIKRHLTALVYGVWDYIKNSGRIGDTANLTLEWVGSLPGKREGRRFLGDHVLTQQEVVRQEPFADGIGAAGWSIDLHPPRGIYSEESPSRHLHADWVYNVPFRCLYSRNVANLFLGGRAISASHVAFGSIRVMGTGAMAGQAAGTAAAQCIAESITPRQLASSPAALSRLRQRLLRDGQHIVGLRNEDPADLARSATVTASSEAVLDERTANELGLAIPRGARVMIPLADPQTEWVELLLSADGPTTLDYELAVNDKVVNYRPNTRLAQSAWQLAGGEQWVRLSLRRDSVPGEPRLDRPQNIWLTLAANDKVALRCQRRRTAGVLLENEAVRAGFYAHSRHTPCIRFARPQKLYAPANVIDGFARPHVFPHSWVSQPLALAAGRQGQRTGQPQWIELALPQESRLGLIQITFNADVNQLIWTQLFAAAADRNTTAELVRDCDVELMGSGGKVVRRFEVRDNHHQVVRLGAMGTRASRVRLTCLSTWGHDRAEVQEVRIYS